MDITAILPVECISHIISCSSPRDACRSSLVSPDFRIAADSDFVWERFLPPDYEEIISKSSSSSSSLNLLSKKDLYFHLCKDPIIIGNGNMSIALEKLSGKKCYMVGARGLPIIWGAAPRYWQWISLPQSKNSLPKFRVSLPKSRFSQVAKLKTVRWLHIEGHIETKNLSPRTTYAAYFVYQLSKYRHGFARTPFVVRITDEYGAVVVEHSVILDVPEGTPPQARDRGDGWIEIEMGEFVVGESEDNATLVCRLRAASLWKALKLDPKKLYST